MKMTFWVPVEALPVVSVEPPAPPQTWDAIPACYELAYGPTSYVLPQVVGGPIMREDFTTTTGLL